MKKIIITVLIALLLFAVGCSNDAADVGDTATPDAETPTVQPDAAEEEPDVIELAFENYTAFREYLSPQNITAFDITTDSKAYQDGEWMTTGRAVSKLSLDGTYGKYLTETYSPPDLALTAFTYLERDGEEIILEDMYSPNMPDEMKEMMLSAPEPPFDTWVDMTYSNLLLGLRLFEIDAGFILDAEIEETDGLVITTLEVDPLGIPSYADTISRNVPLDYDGAEPGMNVDFGSHVTITITTDMDGVPVSSSEWRHTKTVYLGNWGDVTPEAVESEQLSEMAYNAFNADVEVVFPDI